MSVDVIAALRRVPLLNGLDGAQLALLGRASRMRAFPRGAVLYRQRDPPRDLLVLLRGRVKITRQIRPGRELILRVSTAPAVLGEFAAFTARPHVLGATALEPCSVSLVPCSTLHRTIDAAPLMPDLLDLLQECFERVSAHIDVLGGARVEQRLARLLVDLRETEPRRNDPELLIPLGLTREDLGGFIGTTTETVVRVLTRWRRIGVVTTRAGGIVVRSWDVMERLAFGAGEALEHQRG